MSGTTNFRWRDIPKALLYLVGEDRRSYIFYTVLFFLVLFYDLFPAFAIGKIVDFFSHYKPGSALAPFYFWVFTLGVGHIVASVIRLRSKNVIVKVGINAKLRARVRGFERLMDQSLSHQGNDTSGDKVQRIFAGSQSIPEWTNVSMGLFPIGTTFIGVYGVFLFLNWHLLIFLTLYLSCFFTLEFVFTKRLEKLTTELNQLVEHSSGAFMEGAANTYVIKALGAEDAMQRAHKAREEKAKSLELKVANLGFTKWYCFQAVSGVALILFFLLVGRALRAETLSVGMIIVCFTYFERLRSSAGDATDLCTRMTRLKTDLGRMMGLLWSSDEVSHGSELFPKKWNEIRFDDVSLRYPNGTAGMTSLKLTLRRGEKIGIAGPSGGGKSSLVKLLLGLYMPSTGAILIDEKKLTDISSSSLRKNVAVVLQETELFNLTLYENITLFAEVSDEIFQAAIRIARLGDVIKGLPDGLNSMVGEKGYSLSGGERQRVGIARALCKDAPILILDEATSALDVETERAVVRDLNTYIDQGKTLIIAAHRLSALKETDRIFVFETSMLRDSGTFEELLTDKATVFYRLFSKNRDGLI